MICLFNIYTTRVYVVEVIKLNETFLQLKAIN